MDLIRKPRTRCGLVPALLLGAWCNVLHASPRPWIGCLVPGAQEQEAEQATTTNRADAQDEAGASLSDQVIRDVLEPLRIGMETQNIQLVLSVFDKKELNNYSDLQGQLRAFFYQYAEVRLRYQILQATVDKDHGSATADLDMDALPYEFTQVPSRRSVQMRFQLKLEPKGWKVVGFSPSDFFSLEFNRNGGR